MRRLVDALVMVLLWASVAPARAQAPEPSAQIAEIRERLLYADYDEAIANARRYLDRGDLTAAQRNAGLEVLASALIAANDEATAEGVLSRLFARDPDHRLSDGDASPPVQAAFARAREARPAQVEVTLAHDAPGMLAERRSPRVEVRIAAGADAVQELRVAYREAGETRFERVVMSRDADGTATARLPLLGDGEDAVAIDYYIVAVAPSLTPLAHLGSEAEPLRLVIPAARQAPGQVPILPSPTAPPAEPAPRNDDDGGVATKWWFWTIVGVAVAGGVAGAVVATGSDPAQGSLGTVTLR